MKTLLFNICDDTKTYNDIDMNNPNGRLNISCVEDLKQYIKDNDIDINKVECMILPIDYDNEYMCISRKEFDKNVNGILNYFKDNNIMVPIDFEHYTLKGIIDYLNEYPHLKSLKYITDENNYKPISYEELIEVDNYVSSITNYIERFNLSPFEQTLFLTDLIRELKYKSYTGKNDSSISRDLIEVIKKDYIVCEGYANIFKSVLDKLGIDSTVSLYFHDNLDNIPEEKQGIGHATVTAYIVDDKYGINNELAYDLTWGSNNGTGSYLRDYRYIAIPKELDMKIKMLLNNYDGNAMFLKSNSEIIGNRITDFKRLVELSAPKMICDNSYNLVLKKLNAYSNEINIISFEDYMKSEDKENVTYDQKYENVLNYYNKYIKNHVYEIPISTFIEALYNVKRIEKSIDSDKYDEGFHTIKEIVFNRTMFLDSIKKADDLNDIDYRPVSKEAILLAAIYGKEIYPEWYKDEYNFAVNNLENYYGKVYKDDVLIGTFSNKDAKMMSLLSSLRKVSGEELDNPVKNGRKI